MNWQDRTCVKKGNIGEDIVDDYIKSKGIVPYKPDADQPHPFDRLCASADKQRLYIAEVKSKAMRKFFPDTGINLKVFNEYKAIQDRYGIQIFMFFVDDEAGLIYGETLNIISAQHVCMYGGFRNKGTLYPLIDRRIIYFPVEVMREIAVIGVESLKMLAELTTKKQAYKSQI